MRQAARDLRCHPRALTLTQIHPHAVQVHGCGQLRDYAFGVERRRGWSAIEPVHSRASSEMVCPLPELQMEAPSATVRNASGCGRTGRYELVCGALECRWVMTAHGGAWAGEPNSPAAAPVDLEARVIIDAGAQSEGELVVPPPPAAGSPEEHVRAALDARRAAIHQCAGVGAVAVRASWSPDGSVNFLLDSPAGNPEMHTCVALAIGPQRVPPGSAGEIVHPIR